MQSNAAQSDATRSEIAPVYRDQAAWDQAVEGCFDRWSNPAVERLNLLARGMETTLDSAPVSDPAFAWRAYGLAGARLAAGDLAGAQEYYEELLQWRATVDAAHTAQLSRTQWDDVGYRLSGIALMTGRTGEGARLYLLYLSHKYINTILPGVALGFLWILLWHLAPHLPVGSRLSPASFHRCLRWCLIPLLITALGELALPVNSWLLSGNPGAFIASRRSTALVGLLWAVEWLLLLILLRYRLQRALSPGDAGAAANAEPLRVATVETPAMPIALCGPEADPAPALMEADTGLQGRASRPPLHRLLASPIGFCIVSVVAGLFLKSVVLSDPRPGLGRLFTAPYLTVLLPLPLIGLLGPLLEERFYRGTLYAYARREGGMLFGAVFSALLFAASHGRLNDIYALLWGGVIYAVQYELSGSLTPSTITHSINNLLSIFARL